MRKAFGAKIREFRKGRGMSGEDLACSLKCTQANISKIENGLTKPSIKLVSSVAKALALTKDEREELEELASNILFEFDRWTFEESDQYFFYQNRISDAENAAVQYHAFTWNVIPGILQIRDYIVAMHDGLNIEKKRFEGMLDVRISRSKILKDLSKRFRFLIHEQALYSLVSSVSVHLSQLSRLQEVLQRQAKNVELLVVPRDLRINLIPNLNFILLDSSKVLADQQYHTQFIWYPGQVEAYRVLFNDLWDRTLSHSPDNFIDKAKAHFS